MNTDLSTETARAVDSQLPKQRAFLPVETAGGVIDRTRHQLRELSLRFLADPDEPEQIHKGRLALLLICLLPTLLASLYYGVFAADQYSVEMRFNIVPVAQSMRDSGGLLEGGGAKAAASAFALNSFVVTQYIASRTMVEDVGKVLDIRKMYSTEEADFLARLDPAVSPERLLLYWQKHVDAYFELTNGAVIVTVTAFTPEDALRLSQEILKLSEKTVNELSDRARAKVMEFAQKVVADSASHLLDQQQQLLAFRQKEKVFDPVQDASANTSSVASLRQGLVELKGQAAAMSKYLSEDSPNLELLRAKIKASEEQLRSIQNSLPASGGKGSTGSAEVMSSYEALKAQVSIAQGAYQSALAGLTTASRAAESETIYLTTFIPPSLPVEATEPARLKSILMVFLTTFAVWGIGTLIGYSIADHRS